MPATFSSACGAAPRRHREARHAPPLPTSAGRKQATAPTCRAQRRLPASGTPPAWREAHARERRSRSPVARAMSEHHALRVRPEPLAQHTAGFACQRIASRMLGVVLPTCRPLRRLWHQRQRIVDRDQLDRGYQMLRDDGQSATARGRNQRSDVYRARGEVGVTCFGRLNVPRALSRHALRRPARKACR